MKLRYPLILASASPRRKKLLQDLGLSSFEVLPTPSDEQGAESQSYPIAPLAICADKWQCARSLLKSQDPSLILTADTMVFLGQKPLGKPKDETEARSFLQALSGREHEVITAYALGPSHLPHPLVSRWAKTKVWFRPLQEQEIEEYIRSGSPFDKAGGYGYQDDQGKQFVSRLEGLESTVIGLPIELLREDLELFTSI